MDRIKVLTDKTFDQIDTNKNNYLDRNEVQEFMASYIDLNILQTPPQLPYLTPETYAFEMSLHRTSQWRRLEDLI